MQSNKNVFLSILDWYLMIHNAGPEVITKHYLQKNKVFLQNGLEKFILTRFIKLTCV